MMPDRYDTQHVRADALLDSLSTSSERPAPSEPDPIWKLLLDRLPVGMALLDARTLQTLWANAALHTQMETATAIVQVEGLSPAEYLPGLKTTAWLASIEALRASLKPQPPQRLQFVHRATRNITYWEWAVQPADTTQPPRYYLLTVQSVSDVVMNERMLATEARKADQARQRAEALVRLTQLVNAALEPQQLLTAVTEEAAAYFDTPHAGVLLLGPDGEHFHIGYSIGLRPDAASEAARMTRANTLAGHAIAERKTLTVSGSALQAFQMLHLSNGRLPATVVTSPIWHDAHVYGVVSVYLAEARDVPEDARAMLAAFADQTAIALHKADLYRQIAEQRAQLQSIFENAPVGIVYFDTDLRVVAINKWAQQRAGHMETTSTGTPYTALLPDMPPGLLESVRDGTPFYDSHAVVHPPGQPDKEFIYNVSLLPVRDENQQVSGILLLSYDVTELEQARQEADLARKAAETALDQARAAQAQMVQMEKMRAIGELASGVAHDFNNALMAILGYAELAEDSLDSPEALAGYLAIIRKAAEDATSTVQRLQRFARQRVVTNGEPADINTIVQDVVEMTRPRWKDSAQRENRTYRVHVDLQPVPLITGEPSGLREVLINLVYNALEAMPGGGDLTLMTCKHGDDQVEIEVADTGIGMTPEIMARIFDPFFTTRGVEGTGLGLAVSWSIIQRHGGTLSVESKPGVGTRFFLRLPVTTPESPSRAGAAGTGSLQALPTPEGVQILVVDDEPFISSVLASILTRHGYQVEVASSAEDALTLLQDRAPEFNLILTDHGMPGMTGLQLIVETRHRWPDLPVVLLTGWGENMLQTHVPDALPDAILSKPINQNDLLDAVAMILRKRGQAAESGGGATP